MDHAAFDAILRAAVKGRLVDYDAVAARRAALDGYLAAVAVADLAKANDDERLAFYVNAYNARVLRAFLVHGRKRVIDVKGFFDAEKEPVAKEPLTLNALEEKYVRRLDAHGVSRDPRVHFVVNCASRDCPPLAAHAYTGAGIDKDLEERTRAYLTRPGEVVVDDKAHRIVVVQIFEWYAGDFGDPAHGGAERAVRAFLARYVPAMRAKLLDERFDLDYRPYDWSSNAL